MLFKVMVEVEVEAKNEASARASALEFVESGINEDYDGPVVNVTLAQEQTL